MAVTHAEPALTVSEYLATPYQPDRDYVDGWAVERNLGERKHSRIQGLIFALFFVHETDWRVYALPEQRVQVLPDRFRVPDVCVLGAGAPREDIVGTPPLICIEVFSEDDTYRRTHDRARDFIEMGVENVWMLDPYARQGYIWRPTGWERPTSGRLALADSQIVVDLSELFAKLD